MRAASSQADGQDVSPPVPPENRPAEPTTEEDADDDLEVVPVERVDGTVTEADAVEVPVRERATPTTADETAAPDRDLAALRAALLALPAALLAVWAVATVPAALGATLVALAALPVALVAVPSAVVGGVTAALDRGL